MGASWLKCSSPGAAAPAAVASVSLWSLREAGNRGAKSTGSGRGTTVEPRGQAGTRRPARARIRPGTPGERPQARPRRVLGDGGPGDLCRSVREAPAWCYEWCHERVRLHILGPTSRKPFSTGTDSSRPGIKNRLPCEDSALPLS